MPTHTFSSFDGYSAAVQHASLRAIFLGPKRTNWALSYLTMNSLCVQWGQERGADVFEGTAEPGGVSIFVPSQNSRAISGNGRRFDDTSLMVLIPGDEF
jgi:hypothetical protein